MFIRSICTVPLLAANATSSIVRKSKTRAKIEVGSDPGTRNIIGGDGIIEGGGFGEGGAIVEKAGIMPVMTFVPPEVLEDILFPPPPLQALRTTKRRKLSRF